MAKARTPKLSKAEQHYLLTNPEGLTNEVMAKELEVSVATVYNYLKKNKPQTEPTKLEAENQALRARVQELETPPPAKMPTFDTNVGRAFKKGKQVGVIMTGNAGELADETEKGHRGGPNEKYQAAIHNCKTGNKDLPRGKING